MTQNSYIEKIITISRPYLEETFPQKERLDDFLTTISFLQDETDRNAYSEIGLKSWECKNLECFERSKANRGKRFSLKTITTQGRS